MECGGQNSYNVFEYQTSMLIDFKSVYYTCVLLLFLKLFIRLPESLRLPTAMAWRFYALEMEDRGAYCFCPVCHSVLILNSEC